MCRLCGARLRHLVVDLGTTPLANDFLRADQLAESEPRYPLRAMVCSDCWLVQLDHCLDPHRIFSTYAYFSSYSETYRAHADAYVAWAVTAGALAAGTPVVEVASNDGYLLGRLAAHGGDVLGVEAAVNIAAVATSRGIPTLNRFFGAAVARYIVSERGRARLVIANNVLAHVPDLRDFLEGLRVLLAADGLATIEVHDVRQLVEGSQFDHIYHEHCQYFSLTSARAALARHGLDVVDVEAIASENGSLRLHVRHAGAMAAGPRVAERLAEDDAAGVRDVAFYARLAGAARDAVGALRYFLDTAAADGRSVVAYGAAAKGNTLLNAGGIGADRVQYVVDRNPFKQGLFLPGSRLPIHAPERVFKTRPDYLLILPWNFSQEIMQQMLDIKVWGGRFVLPLPTPRIMAGPP
ncbi:MAG: methyltransferase domain-containing protein [Vicinamibacterales bacterium]